MYQCHLHSYVDYGPFKYFHDDDKLLRLIESVFKEDFLEWLAYYKDKFNYNGFIEPKDRIRDLIMH